MLCRSMMSSDEDFISHVCDAFKKAVESASGVTLEGREREFRHVLARRLFDETLGWEGHSKIGEIYDITCFDNENFPIIDIETKWGVEPTREIREKLRRRIEELGSVKYGVFASERELIVYEYADYKLKEITKINVAEATGVARGEYGLSEIGKGRIMKLDLLKRERLVWIEEPEYFEKTYKEISVAKAEGVKLLTENLKDIVRDLTTVLMNFFDSYWKRKDHYSGKFLENTFNDWLKLSMKDEDFKEGNETERRKIMEVFCRETAYVLVGRILFIRMCEDKDILEPSLSGKRLAEFLRFYERRKENVYLHAFYESREEIKEYYSHLHELGFFDWWWISPEKKGLLVYDDGREQDKLEESLNYQIKNCSRRLNRFDFTQVNRDILGDVYQGYLPPDERKRLGEFYTPKEVIEYILDVVGYKAENEIRGKKILDPACGSGGFLVESAQRLIERYRKTGSNLKDSEAVKQVIEECINSILGLDVHPFACFIAEMNLLFQFIDLYDVVRQKYRYYQLPRLNIFRTDSLMPAGKTTIGLIEFTDNSRRKMLIDETRGGDKVKSAKFDYVVGNPPYVRVQRLQDMIEHYRQHYPKSASGLFDVYVLFLESSIKWLKEDGKLGFIVSNMFMSRGYGLGIRSIILSYCKIQQIVDFGDSGVFKEVTNYPCIFVVKKTSDSEERNKNVLTCVRVIRPVKTAVKGMEIDRTLSEISKRIVNKKYSDEYFDIFEYPQNKLTKQSWEIMPIKEKGAFDSIEKNAEYRLRDIVEKIKVGVQTSADEIYIVSQDEKGTYELEDELLKRFLKGANVRRWEIAWNRLFLIYPYEARNGKTILIPENEFKQKYPNIYRYLFRHKEALSKRWGVNVWYELPTVRNLEWFRQPKILTPGLSDKNNFAYDVGQYFYPKGGGGIFGILPKDSMKENVRYLLGLLNSKVLDYHFRHMSPMLSGKFWTYHKKYLEKLPIKLPKTPTQKEIAKKITECVAQILKLNKQTSVLEKKIQQFPDSYFENNWSFDKLMNIAKVHLTKTSYKISEKTLRTYPFKELEYPFREVSRILLATDEYTDFYSEGAASYVLWVLKTLDKVTKRELRELKIPQKPHLKNLLKQYQKDKEQIVKNEKAAKELEKQIDDLVYKIYDITYRERRIIEEYLAKF